YASNLIELPYPGKSAAVLSLIDLMFMWLPGVRGNRLAHNGPLALWFWSVLYRPVLHMGSTSHGPPVTAVERTFVGHCFRVSAARRPSSSLGRRVVIAGD